MEYFWSLLGYSTPVADNDSATIKRVKQLTTPIIRSDDQGQEIDRRPASEYQYPDTTISLEEILSAKQALRPTPPRVVPTKREVLVEQARQALRSTPPSPPALPPLKPAPLSPDRLSLFIHRARASGRLVGGLEDSVLLEEYWSEDESESSSDSKADSVTTHDAPALDLEYARIVRLACDDCSSSSEDSWEE